MSEVLSRPSLILDLTELATLEGRVSGVTPAASARRALPRLDPWAGALFVLLAACACYKLSMEMLARWQWQ